MKKFLIKVNGSQYEVEVEQVGGDSSAVSFAAPVAAPVAAPAAPRAAAPAAAPAPAPAAKPAASGPAGNLKITAPMPGTVLKVVVNPGEEVKKGQVLLVLEAMKMENEIVAPEAGKVATVNVSKGTAVNAGDLLVSLS